MALLNTIMGRAALIGGAVALALIAGLWFQLDHVSNRLAGAKADKRAAIAVNVANQQTIAMLTARVQRLDQINSELFDRHLSINRNDDERRRALEDLADADQTVADFLELPLPSELARLLTVRGAGDSGADGVGAADSPGQP